jgi:hypothetical protein
MTGIRQSQTASRIARRAVALRLRAKKRPLVGAPSPSPPAQVSKPKPPSLPFTTRYPVRDVPRSLACPLPRDSLPPGLTAPGRAVPPTLPTSPNVRPHTTWLDPSSSAATGPASRPPTLRFPSPFPQRIRTPSRPRRLEPPHRSATSPTNR